MKLLLILAAFFTLQFASPAIPVRVSESASLAAQRKEKKIETVVFATNMHCKNCTLKIRENIAYEKGVKDLDVDLENQRITIVFDPRKTDKATLAKAINKLGYKAEEVSGGKPASTDK